MIKAVSSLPFSLLAVVIVASALNGCVSSRQVELEFRVRELEQIIAGKDEDNAELMRYAHELERGLSIQARIIHELDSNCHL